MIAGLKDKHRATNEDEKLARGEAILDAAHDLLTPGHHVLPSVAAVAARAGLAKGTLYLYFQTKEEIYISVLARGMRGLTETLLDAAARSAGNPSVVIAALTRFCLNNPKTLFLATLGPIILEQNVSRDAALRFKSLAAAATDILADAFADAFPRLSQVEARALVLRTWAITVGLWQHANPPPLIREICDSEPRLQGLRMDLETEMPTVMHALWAPYFNQGDRS